MPSTLLLFTRFFVTVSITFLLLLSSVQAEARSITLMNVSYDPTRELYRDYNDLFAQWWQQQTGQRVNFRLSNGGSGTQARSVTEGLPADVATLALAYDIDQLHERSQLIPANWQQRLPYNSAPYTSTVVFLVRSGNPKGIQDWDDLIREDVQVITPNPKTSGGARWNYLAAWAYAEQKYGSKEQARNFVQQLFARVPVLDPGARGATNSFVQRGLGDVFLAWENEAFLAMEKLAPGQFEIVLPSLSMLAEPPVTVIDANVDRRGTRAVAEAYLEQLYSDAAQRLIAQHYYRPANPAIAAEFSNRFPQLQLVTVDDFFGGWQQAQAEHFSNGGVFDQMLQQIHRR